MNRAPVMLLLASIGLILVCSRKAAKSQRNAICSFAALREISISLWTRDFVGIRVARFAIFRQRSVILLGQQLDRVGQVRILDIVGPFRHSQAMGFEQDLGMGQADRWLEFVAGQFDALPERIAEIDRMKNPAIDFAGMFDAALVEPLRRLSKCRPRDIEGHMVDIADAFGVGRGIHFARLIGENGDQAAVAGIEVQVALVGVIQVGLLEDEGHAQHAFPKVDRHLPAGSNKRDMVYSLGLNLLHTFSLLTRWAQNALIAFGSPSASSPSTSLGTGTVVLYLYYRFRFCARRAQNENRVPSG